MIENLDQLMDMLANPQKARSAYRIHFQKMSASTITDSTVIYSLMTNNLLQNPAAAKLCLAYDGDMLSCFGYLIDDEAAVLIAVAQNGNAVRYASQRLRGMVSVGHTAVQQNPKAYEYLLAPARDDLIIAMTAVNKDSTTYDLLPLALQQHVAFARHRVIKSGHYYGTLPQIAQDDEVIARLAVTDNPKIVTQVSPKLLADVNFLWRLYTAVPKIIHQQFCYKYLIMARVSMNNLRIALGTGAVLLSDAPQNTEFNAKMLVRRKERVTEVRTKIEIDKGLKSVADFLFFNVVGDSPRARNPACLAIEQQLDYLYKIS